MKRSAVRNGERTARTRSYEAPEQSAAASSTKAVPCGEPWSFHDRAAMSCTWLVIGYGNELRGDDAAGPHVARAIDEMRLPGVYVMVRQQLTPELADQIAHVDAAIFIDAAVDVKKVSVRQVKCAERADIVAHSNSPEVMMAFAKAAFGHAPRAWLISVPAIELGFRTTLTSRASRGALEAIQKAIELIKSVA